MALLCFMAALRELLQTQCLKPPLLKVQILGDQGLYTAWQCQKWRQLSSVLMRFFPAAVIGIRNGTFVGYIGQYTVLNTIANLQPCDMAVVDR